MGDTSEKQAPETGNSLAKCVGAFDIQRSFGKIVNGASNGHTNEPLVLKVLGKAAGLTAVVAGLLYLAGIATLSVRLWKAGLNPEEYLSLFSLDQLLRTGLTWIAPAIPALAGLAVLLFASTLFEKWLDQRALRFQGERKRELSSPGDGQWADKFSELRKKTDWTAIRREVRPTIKEHSATADIPSRKQLLRRLWLFELWTGVVVFLLLVSTLRLAAPLAAVAIAGLFGTGFLIDTRPALQALLPLSAVIALAFLLNAVLNPRPLPHAFIITKTAPSPHRGNLIGSANGMWYLGQGNGRAMAIPESEVVRLRLEPRSRSASLFDWLKDWGDEASEAD
jgi:hypothetical protein